jgi:hypothetical protein
VSRLRAPENMLSPARRHGQSTAVLTVNASNDGWR